MDIRILGPTEVRHDGSPVVLRGAKPRQLLVLLALRANRPVPTQQLIDELWEGTPPPSAAAALRVHLGHLRRVLEPDRSPSAASIRLPAGPHGYLLRLEPDELDAERFERRVLAAGRANADGAPARAVPQLTEALDLWRGAALVDVRDLSVVRAELTRLEELYALAVEELADARLALGEHALVVDVLAAACDRYPLRETLVARLMVALYRSGRVPDALRAYSALAARLDEQFGVTPSDELRRLEEDVLLRRPTLDLVGRASAEVALHLNPPAARMIGRRRELQELVTSLCVPGGRRPRLTLVAGPAGIGKSTLMRDLVTRAEHAGRRPVTGVCTLHPPEPYAPIAQILRAVAGPGPGEGPRREHDQAPHADEWDSALADCFPAGTDESSARFRFFEAVATQLVRHCQRVMIIVEDLHWADRPTLLLLRHLLRHPQLADTPFVVTYREDEISGQRLELVESLAPPAECQRLQLRPFHDGEVRRLIRDIAAPESVALLADHASALRDATGGNPLFLRELLRELDEASVKLVCDADVTAALAQVAPANVRALIDRRIDRLGETGRLVVYAAACLADGISTELLADLCDIPTASVRDAVEECLAVRLLVEDSHNFDRFLFPHALVCNAVYAGIPPRQRMGIHGRIAAVLAREGGSVRIATLARHLCEAAPLGLGVQASEHAALAGADAQRHLLFSEAAAWYERALALRPNPDADAAGRGALLLALGKACVLDKQIERANQAFAEAAGLARGIGDFALMADVATAGGPWTAGPELGAATLPLLEEALAGLPPEDIVRRVKVLAGIASDLYYIDPGREGEFARLAMEAAARSADPEATATALLASHRWWTHDPAARRHRLELTRAGRDGVDPRGPCGELFLVLERSLLADLLENEEIGEFESALADYEHEAVRIGSPRDIYWSMALRATEATLHGDLAAAEQLARGAALRGHELDQLSEGALLLQRFVIRYQQGRLAEEVPVLRHVYRANSVFQAGAGLAATSLAEVGRQERANEVVWETLGPDGSRLARDIFWLGAVALFSGVAAQGEDRRLQELLAELLAPCADHLVVFGAAGAVLGSGHQWLGVLRLARGDLEGALDHLHQARVVADRVRAPFWGAQARLDASRALAARGRGGDREQRVQLAEAALGTARSLGFGRLLRSPALV